MRRGLVAAGLAFGALACRVDQAAEVAEYRRVLDRGLPAAADTEEGAPIDARTAMRLANAHHEGLAIEGEAYLRALVDRRRAAAAWLPVLALGPSYFLNDASGGTDDGFDLRASAALDVNPRGASADRARAEVEVERQRALLYDAQDVLWLDVARTLFEVLRAERSAAVLRGSLTVQEARVEDVRARRDVGFARPLDVSLSESSAADARVALLDAENRARTGRALLGFLTGTRLERTPLDATLEVPDDAGALGALVEEALRRRQDAAAASLRVETASREVELAAAQWWPSIGVDLDYFLTRDSQPSDQDWRALFGLRLPLFSGGRIRADVRDALSVLRAAKLERSLVARGVRRDVEVAFENLRASRQRIDELRVQLATAREAFDQAEGLYDAGLATNLERLTAQDDRLRTELALENAELERKVFYLDLLRASGRLHEWLGVLRPDAAETEERAEAR